MEFEFTDRYKAMGIPYPDPETVCQGQCEGTGWIPIHKDEHNEKFLKLWKELHTKCSWTISKRIKQFFKDWKKILKYGIKLHWTVCFGKCDGWHFVKCPECKGTGKQNRIQL